MARYRRIDLPGLATREAAPELDDVRSRRAGLKTAMSNLELALAAPAPNREAWVSGVQESLAALHDVWVRHTVDTEAPGAFLDELVADSTRLATPASRLRRDHTELLATITSCEERLAVFPPSGDYDAWVDGLRIELTAVLIGLAKHRQRGADLIYEAYDVDIGGGF